MLLLAIGQVDVSLYSVLVKELTTCYTVRLLLNKKTFEYEQSNDCQNDRLVLKEYPEGHIDICMTFNTYETIPSVDESNITFKLKDNPSYLARYNDTISYTLIQMDQDNDDRL